MPADTPILLSDLSVEDAGTVADRARDEVFLARAGWSPGLRHEEHLAFWRRLDQAPPPELLRLVAERRGAVVGTVDLHGLEPGIRELGYVVGPSANWGQGLDTAVARAGLTHAFDVLELEVVWAEALPANSASGRILRRLGMRPDGHGEVEEFLGVPGRFERYRITREQHRRGLRAEEPLSPRGAGPAPAGDRPGTARSR
ncbi:GNAT family N-acetyltransferase [Brachybacterium sp. AOP43-C2-M15]|uniref:GNAT family N-acetyltransferase n=1 Tax=Brachybacterium sp. AOP43-C2-M15 TaxID=3457661 RepID=UPI00403317D0